MPLSSPVPIAFVMSSFEPGGTERQMIELIRRLDRNRWSVHVACLRSRGEWFDKVRHVAATTDFPVDSFRRLRVIDRMKSFSRWCQEQQFAIVHAVDLPSNLFGLPAAALAGVPLRIGTRREINPGRSFTTIAAQRAAYSCAHKIVANAGAAAARLRFERVPRHKIAVIPNGLDVHLYHSGARSAAPRRVVVVANLRPEKGHDVLIEAAVKVLRNFPDAQFEAIGGGTELKRLMALAEARGVAGAFQFLGHREDVSARLGKADIFVLPSRSEAFPNAVLEAMASGLPVVASGVGGILESIEDERTGLLVPPGDSIALAEKICRLMGDPWLGARLGTAARLDAERYSFDRMIAAFDRLYSTELAERGIDSAPKQQLAS